MYAPRCGSAHRDAPLAPAYFLKPRARAHADFAKKTEKKRQVDLARFDAAATAVRDFAQFRDSVVESSAKLRTEVCPFCVRPVTAAPLHLSLRSLVTAVVVLCLCRLLIFFSTSLASSTSSLPPSLPRMCAAPTCGQVSTLRKSLEQQVDSLTQLSTLMESTRSAVRTKAEKYGNAPPCRCNLVHVLPAPRSAVAHMTVCTERWCR